MTSRRTLPVFHENRSVIKILPAALRRHTIII